MSQLVNKAKAWNTPFGVMVSLLIISCLQSVITFTVIKRFSTGGITGLVLFNMLFWPLLILVDAIVYWMIRKRIMERKWVWAHLLFSLFAFVVLTILRITLYALIPMYAPDEGRDSIRLISTIEDYCFFSSVILGHTFFIIALVRIYSGKNPQPPPDDNDLLSEFAS
jgi:hypothetical protein